MQHDMRIMLLLHTTVHFVHMFAAISAVNLLSSHQRAPLSHPPPQRFTLGRFVVKIVVVFFPITHVMHSSLSFEVD